MGLPRQRLGMISPLCSRGDFFSQGDHFGIFLKFILNLLVPLLLLLLSIDPSWSTAICLIASFIALMFRLCFRNLEILAQHFVGQPLSLPFRNAVNVGCEEPSSSFMPSHWVET